MAVDLQPVGYPGLVGLPVVRLALFGDETVASDHDDLLQSWIDAASAKFEDQCKQEIRTHTRTELYTGNGTPRLALRFHPVTAVASVEVRDAVGEWTTIDADTYDLDAVGGHYRIVYPSGFCRGASYRVTMTVGYTSVPDDVADIVCQSVIDRYLDNPRAFGGGRIGLLSEAHSGATGEKNGTTAFSPSKHRAAWAECVARYQKHSGF